MFKATLWVKPHAMKRPRMTRKGHVYSPSAGVVRIMASELMVCGFRDWAERHKDDAIEVFITFRLKQPKKTKFTYPTSKRHGDIDNHIKTVLDAINHFVPDEQVVKINAQKRFAEDDSVGLIVSRYGKANEGSAEG